MEFQGLEGVDLGRNLRMVQSLERPEGCGQFLNANFGIGGREVLGLGLGVGRRGMSKNESEMMRVSQLERGDPVGWRSLEGHTGGITEVLPIEGRTDHIEPGMAMILEGTVSRHDVRAPQGEGQRGEGTELSGREQRDTWRIQSVDGLQVMNERGTSGRIGMGGERWRHGGRGLNVQDWSKHGFEGKGNEEQEINLAATKTDDSSLQVLYRECQRNLGLGKGATVLDGCAEFMACAEEGIPDALKCGACSCHRNFHRRIVIRGDEVVWEQREDVARRLEEALSTIRKIGDDIKTSAGRALPLLSQEKRSLQGRDISHQNHAALFKSCVQALGQVANAMLATSDCLALLQKSNGGHTVCPQDTRRIEELKRLPALITSSDASPVNKSEQKLGSPTSFPPQKSPSTTFSSPMFGWQGSTDQCVSDRAPLTAAAEGGYNEQKQKRKRTRFTFEQLKKLNDFAARTGWTLTGVAKEEIDAVCTDIGIGSVTLKYWIHNMRQKSKRRHEDGKKTPPATP